MAVINLTLDNLRLPGLPNFTPDFGTKESEGVSVNTENVCKDIMLPFTVERPVFVNENSSTSEVQTSRTLILGQSAITVSIGRPSFASCKLTLKAAFVSGYATVTYSKAENVTQTIYLRPGDCVELVCCIIEGGCDQGLDHVFVLRGEHYVVDGDGYYFVFTVYCDFHHACSCIACGGDAG